MSIFSVLFSTGPDKVRAVVVRFTSLIDELDNALHHLGTEINLANDQRQQLDAHINNLETHEAAAKTLKTNIKNLLGGNDA